MATSKKRKKFSLSSLFSILLAILPEILSILNDPDASDSVQVQIDANASSGRVKTTILEM